MPRFWPAVASPSTRTRSSTRSLGMSRASDCARRSVAERDQIPCTAIPDERDRDDAPPFGTGGGPQCGLGARGRDRRKQSRQPRDRSALRRLAASSRRWRTSRRSARFHPLHAIQNCRCRSRQVRAAPCPLDEPCRARPVDPRRPATSIVEPVARPLAVASVLLITIAATKRRLHNDCWRRHKENRCAFSGPVVPAIARSTARLDSELLFLSSALLSNDRADQIKRSEGWPGICNRAGREPRRFAPARHADVPASGLLVE